MAFAQFARFAVAGGIAAAANFGSRLVFSVWLPFSAAVVLAYGVGMVVAFVLMRRFVFSGHSGSMASQVTQFVLVNALAVVQTLLVSLALGQWLLPRWMPVALAQSVGHAVGIVVPIATSFLAHRTFTFR